MTLLKSIKYSLLLSICFSANIAFSLEFTQHLKANSSYIDYSDPLLSIESNTLLNSLNYRLNVSEKINNFKFVGHYQVSSLHSNQHDLNFENPDDNKLFNLSSSISENNEEIILHRLDRLYIAYNTSSTSTKIGRQAITWGNGLVYNVMDIFNPFSPTSLDKEYKSGDDMFYFQYLSNSGDDWQALYLPRRDDEHSIDSSISSFAIKYHSTFDSIDFNLILSKHFDDEVSGIGLSRSIGDALWRLDLTNTQIKDDNFFSLVTNIDYSWTSFNKNIYGFLEFYHNGFGNDDYVDLTNIALNERLARGEIFTLFKNYIAAGLNVELHPLLNFSPTIIHETKNNTSTIILGLNYDWKQNLNIKSNLVRQNTQGLSSESNSLNIQLSFYF